MAYYLNVQNHQLEEINGRLLRVVDDVISGSLANVVLDDEQKHALRQESEFAQRVSLDDIEKKIKVCMSIELIFLLMSCMHGWMDGWMDG